MNKSKLLKTTVAIVALAALVTGGYVYKAAIYDKLQHKITVRVVPLCGNLMVHNQMSLCQKNKEKTPFD